MTPASRGSTSALVVTRLWPLLAVTVAVFAVLRLWAKLGLPSPPASGRVGEGRAFRKPP